MHGLPKLVQLVGRVESLQANVCKLHLFFPQLRAQLRYLLLFRLLLLIGMEQPSVRD
jgi:hypothetical protein